MPFIGNKPSAVPLTSADIADGIITSAKIVDGTIVNADINASSAITLNKLSGNPSFRNRIINGDMQIDQRNAGASVTPSSGTRYLVDRWRSNLSQSSKLSFQQNGGAVTPPTNFINYIGITSLSSYSTAASDYFQFEQFIEGLNISDLNFGTANAKTFTISFYARSSLTGNFGLFLTNSAVNRVYPTSYTINSANTWELKTITIAGDTSGTWLTTNETGIRISFNMAYGSTYTGTGNAWNAGTIFQPSGCQNLVGTNGATLYITGVQLEAGTSATDFEFLPIDVDLARCQRYYYLHSSRSGNFEPIGIANYYNNTDLETYVKFPFNMRTDPTLVSGSGTDYYRFDRNNGTDYVNSFTLNMSMPTNAVIYNNSEASGTGGQAGHLFLNNDGAYVAFSAEL
jgi:hypothetical protein